MKATGGTTLDQRRARHAWESWAKVTASERENFLKEVRALPIRILTAGLGHAVLFSQAKDRDKSGKVLRSLEDWLLVERRLSALTGSSGPDQPPSTRRASGQHPTQPGGQLMQDICEGDASFLRLATAEALVYLKWLSRFADAGTDSTESEGS